MPFIKIYSFADFGVADESFLSTVGATGTLSSSSTTDTIHISDDDPTFSSATGANDPNQVLAADLYVDGALVGVVGDAVTAGTFAHLVTNTSGTGGGYFTDISSILINGVPVGIATYAPFIPTDIQFTNQTNSPTTDLPYYFYIKCFTAGTLITCQHGEAAVETLQAGDLVRTKDHGFQPVRWIYHQTVSGLGPLAPICFKAGAMGNAAELVVSPMHRMLVSGPMAEMLFGAPSFLAHAKDLCNGRDIYPKPNRKITYFHILFDQHELISAHGCWSESFAASSAALDGMEQAVIDELMAIFPNLGADWCDALPTLNASEAALLLC